MTRVAVHLAPLLSELRVNRRLQAGLAMIGLLTIAWLWLVLGDWHQALVKETGQLQARAVRMQQLAGQEVWIERAEQARQLREGLVAELPQADSPGLAQASVQSWLREVIEGTGTEARIRVDTPVRMEQPTGALRIGATVSGSLPARQVLQLLRRIEGHTNLMTVESVLIRSDENQTYTLTLHAYYRLRQRGGESP